MATLKQRVLNSRKNFGDFCAFVGGLTLGTHQTDWIEACQDIADNPTGGQKYIVVAPPGFGKSEIIAKLFTTFMIGRYPENHGALLSYGGKPAKARSNTMRQVVANDKAYRLVYPHIHPDRGLWNVESFNVVRKKISPHPTMLVGSTRSAVISYRINWLVMDDAIDQKQAANVEQRLKAWQNYKQAIFTRLTRGAPQMNIGTRWSDDDFIAELMKDSDWKLIHVAALKNGRSVWPRGKTTKELLKIKQDDPELFQIQYMGAPGAKGIGIIKRIATYKQIPDLELIKEKDLLVGAGWDTAFKDKQQNDYTVGYIGGLDKHRRVWVLDRRKDRFTTPALIEEIKDVQKVWDPFYQWIEDAASGTPAVDTIKEEAIEGDLPIDTVPPTQGGKRSRAHALAPYLHNGTVIFPKYTEWYEDSHYYLTRYPFISFDDDIDALYVLVTELRKLMHPSTYGDRGKHRLVMG